MRKMTQERKEELRRKANAFRDAHDADTWADMMNEVLSALDEAEKDTAILKAYGLASLNWSHGEPDAQEEMRRAGSAVEDRAMALAK